jgi:cobalt transporter subunit CbtB
MSTTTIAAVQPIVSAKVATIAGLFAVAFFALLSIYFVGIDEGAMSVFGKTMVLHELMHDGRHLLGFPCH